MKYYAAIILLALTACTTGVPVKPEPPDVHVAGDCMTRCVIDPLTLSDLPGDNLELMAAAFKQCEAKRSLCAAAIQRARDVKAIK